MKSRIAQLALAAILGGVLVSLLGVSEIIRRGFSGVFLARERAKPAKIETGPGENSGSVASPGVDQATGEVRLSPEQIKLVGLRTEVARQTRIEVELRLNGEVTANQDRIVQILPRTPGIVREVLKHVGDSVRANEPLAVIESRELAEAQAAYLAALGKAQLAQTNAQRKETLYEKKITSEQEYLVTKQAAEVARIELQAAEQKLVLLGLDPKGATTSLSGPSKPVRVSVVAPFDGTLIEERLVIGEQVTDQSPLFRIANLDEIWVLANVFERDLSRVSIGQPATVVVRAYPDRKFEGKITWIADVLDQKTRTLKVRAELDNRERLLKPGIFAQVYLKTILKENGVAVPPAAIQRQKSQTVVFVDTGRGIYTRREVKIGGRSDTAVEILDGLKAGDAVVTTGSFALKSELEKSAAGDSH